MSLLSGVSAPSASDLSVEDLLPRMLPAGWADLGVYTPPTRGAVPLRRFVYDARPLTVLVSLDDYDDGAGIWLHSSTSHRGRLPNWDDLKRVHEVVHGDRPVVQLMPPREHWLSISDCLHLWERMDAPTVPETLWRAR